MESSCSIDFNCDQILSSPELVVDNRKNLITTITLKCKEEMENNCLNKPLDDYIERVATYTGLSKHSINQVISQDLKDIDHKKKYFELKDRIEIFKYIADIYSKNQIPTYTNIYTLFKNNHPLLMFPQFQYMMNCLGFEYHKTKLEKEILLEDPSLTFQRYLYLKQLTSLRAKCAPVYYIDERVFDSTCTFLKPHTINNDIDVSLPGCDAYVFFHAVSKQGFLSGLFCSPASTIDFIKWVSHILIPLFSGPSVIVLDNNDLHGSSIDTITKYHSRNDMVQYLKKRNIPCSENMHKAELYDLITKCTIQHNCYDVDEIFKAHGHHVLRLPSNFYDLSMTHFLWQHFLQSKQNIFSNVHMSQMKTVLLERLSNIPHNLWEGFHESLVRTEENILKIDSKTYKALETFEALEVQFVNRSLQCEDL